MQVKKFEARTMKEALDMVKIELGPDAIILSARDNHKSFGLVGEGSVEITAAISEQTLQKKLYTESRMREEDRKKFNESSARSQKEIIEKMISKFQEKKAPHSITSKKYIEIDSDEIDQKSHQTIADERIKMAVQRAWNEFQTHDENIKNNNSQSSVFKKITDLIPRKSNPVSTSNKQPNINFSTELPDEFGQIGALKNEIQNLKNLVSQFQAIPQTMNQSSYPGSDYQLPYELSYMFEKLVREGVAPEITATILTEASKNIPPIKFKSRGMIDGWVAPYILQHTRVVENPSDGKIHCFMGPGGSGKTSSLVKFASHLVVRERKKIAILTADTIKVGAADQLKIYAQILNVPFSIIRNPTDWQMINRNMNQFDAILVDFPGFGLKRQEDMNILKNLIPTGRLDKKIHLVLSVTGKDLDLREYGRRYSLFNYNDVIFSGLDESLHHGSIFNFMRDFDIPLHSFSIGPKIPEDYEYATPERVLDLLFKITQVRSQEKIEL